MTHSKREDVKVTLTITAMIAWGTSVAVSAKASLWLMLVLDFIVFPVGIADGVGIWFGLWK